MEKLFRYSSILIKPMFRIALEPLNAVNVGSPFGFSFLFVYHHMFTPQTQRSVGMPIICIVKASRFSVRLQKILNTLVVSTLNGKNSDFAIPLQDSQHNNFPRSSPASLPRFSTSKHRLIALNLTLKRFLAFLRNCKHTANGSEEFLNRFIRNSTSETKCVNWNSQNKIFQNLPPLLLRNSKRVPEIFESISKLTLAALKPTFGEFPCPVATASRTLSFHKRIFYKIFGPFSLAITLYYYIIW